MYTLEKKYILSCCCGMYVFFFFFVLFFVFFVLFSSFWRPKLQRERKFCSEIFEKKRKILANGWNPLNVYVGEEVYSVVLRLYIFVFFFVLFLFFFSSFWRPKLQRERKFCSEISKKRKILANGWNPLNVYVGEEV